MAKAYYEYTTDKGSQVWGRWICTNVDVRSNIINFCRKALGDRYQNYHIDPIYFDDKYYNDTTEFFSEVGVNLYETGSDNIGGLMQDYVGEPIHLVIKGKICINLFNETCKEKIKSIKVVNKL